MQDVAIGEGEDAFNAVLGRELKLAERLGMSCSKSSNAVHDGAARGHAPPAVAAKASGVAQRYVQLLLAHLRK
jgi:hypothetical protein